MIKKHLVNDDPVYNGLTILNEYEVDATVSSIVTYNIKE